MLDVNVGHPQIDEAMYLIPKIFVQEEIEHDAREIDELFSVHNESFAEAASFFPELHGVGDPVDAYLRHLEAAKAALDAGLVDKLADRQAFEKRLAELGGDDDKAIGGYQRIKLPAYRERFIAEGERRGLSPATAERLVRIYGMRAEELWRVPASFLDEAQDDATRIAKDGLAAGRAPSLTSSRPRPTGHSAAFAAPLPRTRPRTAFELGRERLEPLAARHLEREQLVVGDDAMTRWQLRAAAQDGLESRNEAFLRAARRAPDDNMAAFFPRRRECIAAMLEVLAERLARRLTDLGRSAAVVPMDSGCW